ncbi:MAG: LysR family transcriptional regulator [Pseudomonadota bacterium]
MDKFAALRAFTLVVDEGGFAAAGRALGQSRSAVNRLVLALEDELGAQLLNRTTRQVSATATGVAFYEKAQTILAELAAAERAVGETRQTAAGRFRINAPMSFGTLHLGPAVADFMAQHPDIQIEMQLNDRFVDVIEEGFDLVIRIAEPREDTTMVDFRLCEAKRVICASPDYLAAHGMPDHPADLKRHKILQYGHQQENYIWRLNGPTGQANVTVTSVLCSNNGEVLRDAAVQGLGIMLGPTFIVGGDLQLGRLVSILPDYQPPQLMLTALYPPTRHLSANIRLFTDFLMERFGSEPHWDLVA